MCVNKEEHEMLHTVALFLGLLTLATANPDLITDCAYDCPLEVDDCGMSGECTRFFSYFDNNVTSGAYATSSEFITGTTTYCNKTNATTGAKYSICDGATYTLISCMETSSCWLSTTSYSASCPTYATTIANFTAYSTSLTQTQLCTAHWDSFFDNYFGSTDLTVTVALQVNSCIARRRALLQEDSETSESESESETTTEETVLMQITVEFYTASAYEGFYNLLANKTLISGFTSAGYIASSLALTCMTTTCCDPSVGLCTTAFDDDLCNSTAPPTTTPATTEKNDASINSFVLFNFVVINIIAYACLF